MGVNATRIRLERVVLIIFLCAWSAVTASAQSRAAAPVQQDSRLTAAAAEELRRQGTGVVRIERRRSDSLLNGALIGAGAGVASGLLLCRAMEPWRNCRDDVGPMLGFGAIGAGIGMGIDALIRGGETIYQPAGTTRLQVAPVVGRSAGGLRVAVSF